MIGAVLDRNGLRPSRYYVTKDDLVIMASEVGVLDIPPENILLKERLHPGRIFLVDTEQGRIVSDDEIKRDLAAAQPYAQWLAETSSTSRICPTRRTCRRPATKRCCAGSRRSATRTRICDCFWRRWRHGGEEAIGSMGTDTSLAVLSDRPRLLYDYFKQVFAQVTNPPLDAIREELVTAMGSTIGPEGNLLDPRPESCRQIAIKYSGHRQRPAGEAAAHLRAGVPIDHAADAVRRRSKAGRGLERALRGAEEPGELRPLRSGYTIIILSDRGVGPRSARRFRACSRRPASTITSCAKARARAARCVVESGDAREVHHCALLLGYGAGVVNPYLAFETLDDMIRQRLLVGITHEKAVKNYIKALNKGILKVMSKMGISTLQSYCGAQIFEAVGLEHRSSSIGISRGLRRASAASAST